MSKSSGFYQLFFLIFLGAFQSSCRPANHEANQTPDFENAFNLAWADSTYWDDGKAEVARYQATREIYGKLRKFDYMFITVSEHFNKEFNVKTDDYTRKDLYRVMKLNAFADIPTDNYPYHFLSSLFLSRDRSTDLFKATLSSQEWCGNTFKEFIKSEEGYKLNYNSYWDSEGSGSKKIANSDLVLFEDQLIYSLRSLNFKDGLVFEASVLPTQVGNKVGKQELVNVTFRVSEQADFWEIEMKFKDGRKNGYKFGKSYPNILVEQKTWNNQNLRLMSSNRTAYWQ